MTEIEVPDPGEELVPGEGEGGESPYRNLLVPLVVVPALIVMVIVLVVVLFGLVAGEAPSPADNIDRLLYGGANEREQAAFSLVQQMLSDKQEMDPVAWAAQLEELQPKLRAALEENRDFETPGEVSIPLALTILLAEGGDPDGVAQLAEMTGLSDDLDPEGKYRLYAAFALGKVGSGLAGPERTTASRALVRLLNESPDLGIRVIAAAGLQRLPTEEGRAALVEALRDPALELRGSAALSLGELGDPSGVPVLREMVQVAAYDSERGVSAQKWSLPDRVSESRCKALLALSKLNQAPGPEELRQMADEDPDVNVRETALRLLAEDSGG